MVLECDSASAFAETTIGEEDTGRGKAFGAAGVDLLPLTGVVVDMCSVVDADEECCDGMDGAVKAVAESVCARTKIAAVKISRPAFATLRDAGVSDCSYFC